MCLVFGPSTPRLGGAAGELHEFGPGLLRDEAFLEQTGAVAEIARFERVVDREPVDVGEAEFRLVLTQQGEGAFQFARLAGRADGEDVARADRRVRGPAELGDPEVLDPVTGFG